MPEDLSKSRKNQVEAFDLTKEDSPVTKIDARKSRYPYCIVWTPLPMLSWFLPFIGHLGIANSEGITYDFGGPYYMAVDNFTFGRPTRALRLDISKIPRSRKGQTKADIYDNAVTEASSVFGDTFHNLLTNNCHHHVAAALNHMKYDNRDNWNIVELGWNMWWYSEFVEGSWGMFRTFAGSFFIYVFMIVIAMTNPVAGPLASVSEQH